VDVNIYKKPIARADRLKNAIQSAGFNIDSRKRRLQQNVFLAWWADLSVVPKGAFRRGRIRLRRTTMAYFSPSALAFFTASGVDLGMSQHGGMV